MLKKLRKNQGFASFVEIIITSIIFLIAGFGIFTAISMLRPHGVDSAKKLEAAYIALQMYSTLRNKVDADYWDNASGSLAVGSVHTQIVNGYQVNWALENVPGLELRQLTMNVTEL